MTRETMGDVEHTHPHTGRAFGENGGVFTRGPAVADGGTDSEEEMRDVEHTAPHGDGANEVWERGVETIDAETDTAETDGAKASSDGGVAKDTTADE